MGETSRIVTFDEIGGPEVLRLGTAVVGEPGPGELRLRIDAIGLNRAEVLFRSGGYYEQPKLPDARLGIEAAGAVEAVGPDVTGFAPGDTVSVVATYSMNDYGVYADRALVPAASVLHRHPSVDATTGAAVWVAGATAYGALVERGGLAPGDHALITAASSSVGVAAIRVANHLGALPVAVTRTSAKRDQLLAEGAAHVIALDEEDLLAGADRATGGRGAAVVLDPVGGPGLATLAHAVAPEGTLVVCGWLDDRPMPMPRNWPIDVHGFGVPYVLGNPARRRRTEHFVNAALRAGTLTPTVDRTFRLEDIAEAHRYMESNQQLGKIVVTVTH